MIRPVYEMVRDHRKRAGITQKHIAAKVGQTASHISAIENGTVRLTADEFVAICINGFGMTPGNFFDNELSENENIDT